MKAVIFDMDGTMFDSEKLWQEMWQDLLKEYGYEANPRFGRELCGSSGEAAHAAGCLPMMVPDLLEPTKEIYDICYGVYPTLFDVKDAIAQFIF